MTADHIPESSRLKKVAVQLSDHNRSFVLSPLRLMFTLLLCIFAIETAVMLTLEYHEPVGWIETLIDSSILTTTLFVILYYSLFKPLVELIADYKLNKSELENSQNQLQQMVLKR